ncbi:hypothetical protein GCM10008013_28310 [Paenibacillus segetis]|uniref:Uncharacterized protein n=1 Tax=Paenibacillus segetis TaxID=1325360 RepID=A0ABQ1YJK9_9BACL|nr:hypothetical protein GCM10008013_28310 [Paenibacillus segetis]
MDIAFNVLPILLLIFYIVLAVLVLGSLVMFIRLASRGIKALDIYIKRKGNF